MTRDQAAIAVLILNSYAHQYLGLPLDRVMVSGGKKDGAWVLLVATEAGMQIAADLDAAKLMIDEVAA